MSTNYYVMENIFRAALRGEIVFSDFELAATNHRTQ